MDKILTYTRHAGPANDAPPPPPEQRGPHPTILAVVRELRAADEELRAIPAYDDAIPSAEMEEQTAGAARGLLVGCAVYLALVAICIVIKIVAHAMGV